MMFDRMNLSTEVTVHEDHHEQGSIIGMLSRNPSQMDPHSVTMVTR